MKIHFKKQLNDDLYYEFIEDSKIPDLEKITCVFSLVLFWDKVFLTKNHRWWELPWWHIENSENLEQALRREIREEVCTDIDTYKIFWYKKYYSKKKILKRDWWYYPFPNSYILFYISKSNWKIHDLLDYDETLDFWLFSIKDALEKVSLDEGRRKLEILYNSNILKNDKK